jgi:putative ABC transport system permease protein
MLVLALRSLRFRTSAFLASFLAMFLGATILMTFASMLDTAMGDGVPAASREKLLVMANVVGGWGLLLVAFAVTSTLTLSVRQRGTEIALLKSVGATPAQIRRMIVGEAAVVALVAAILAIPPAVLGGRGLLELLISTDQVASDVAYVFGPVAVSMGLGITFAGATIAAALTARRTTRMRTAESLADAATDDGRMSRTRIIAGLLFLGGGLNLGVVTATVMRDKGSDAMQTAGSASILSAIGLSLFGPLLVRRVTAVLALPLERMAGAGGYLTAQNVRQRTNQMATALMPIILFTGIAAGTLYMQDIDNGAVAAAGLVKSSDQKAIETLNLVVIGMISLFACIMLINTLVAATTYRGREFGRQRLAGATPGQVLRMVGFEAVVLAATGVFFGTIAALVTVLPYSIARTDSLVPDSPIWIYVGIVAVAVIVTLASSVGTARRAIRTPAVDAAA